MSAVALTKRLLSLDFLKSENEFFRCLKEVFEVFRSTRNPLIPRQEVIQLMVDVLSKSTRTSLLGLALALLAEFTVKSSTYDCDFIKKQLLDLHVEQILCKLVSRCEDHLDVPLAVISMRLLRAISTCLLPMRLQYTLADIIPMCLALCSPRRHLLFSFKPAVKDKLKSLLIGKALVLDEEACDEGAGQAKVELMTQLFGCGAYSCNSMQQWTSKMQLSHSVGDVFDTTGEEDINIGDLLATQDLVWQIPHQDRISREVYKDVIPTMVISGPHFLAHEIDNIQQIADLEEVLNSLKHIQLQSNPTAADHITVKGPISSKWSKLTGDIFYRAQVCYEKMPGVYMVLALDYGLIREVTAEQMYRPCMSLLHIKSMTTLCSIKGIQAGPQSLDVLEDALGVLLILTNGNYTVVESMARRRAAHKVLLELAATAPHQHICVNSLNVIANMAHCSRTRLGELNEDEVYKQVIALLGPYSDRKWREAVLAACHAVTNLMFENDKVDPDKQVLNNIINALGKFTGDEEVRKSVMQILINCLPGLRNEADMQAILRNASYEAEGNVSSATARSAPSTERASSDVESSRDRPDTSGHTSDYVSDPEMIIRTSQERQRSRQQEERARSKSRTRNFHRTISVEELEQQVNSGLAMNQTSQKTRNRTFYILGEQTDLRHSERIVLMENDRQLDSEGLRKLLVGFLNAGLSGTVHCGIDPDGTVVGVQLDRDRRDMFRLGVDRVGDRIDPKLGSYQLDILFQPVCLRQGANNPELRSFIPDRFVLEVSIPVCASGETYKLRDDRTIYLRVGTQNIAATTQDLRELVIRQMEAQLTQQ